jgi:hypothetical protein
VDIIVPLEYLIRKYFQTKKEKKKKLSTALCLNKTAFFNLGLHSLWKMPLIPAEFSLCVARVSRQIWTCQNEHIQAWTQHGSCILWGFRADSHGHIARNSPLFTRQPQIWWYEITLKYFHRIFPSELLFCPNATPVIFEEASSTHSKPSYWMQVNRSFTFRPLCCRYPLNETRIGSIFRAGCGDKWSWRKSNPAGKHAHRHLRAIMLRFTIQFLEW